MKTKEQIIKRLKELDIFSTFSIGLNESCFDFKVKKVKRGRLRKTNITSGKGMSPNNIEFNNNNKNINRTVTVYDNVPFGEKNHYDIEETRTWKILGGYELSVTKKNGVFEKAFFFDGDASLYPFTEEQLEGLKNALNEI